MLIRALVAAAAALFLVPNVASAADWRGSFNASYQAAQPGDTVVVPAGTYGNQVIQYRGSVANLANGCTPQDTSKCIRFVMAGPVTVGLLEIRGSSVWVDGGNQLRARGYIDTEADSAGQHPDHVIVEKAGATAFGVFNADTVTFKDLDVGPQTLGNNCGAIQGPGMENKIGYGGGVVYVPRNITLDGLRVHNQNVNSAGRASGCHFGGLFIVTADGLTIKNSTFERNVVYHVQIQNFGGAPPAKRVVFDRNSFGCPVEWLNEKGENTCDGQAAIQFDYDPAGQFTLTNNVAANGAGGLYGCYVGTCGGLSSLIQSGNVNLASSPTAPPLLGNTTPPPPPPPPPPPDCGAIAGVPSLPLTKVAEDATTVTFSFQPVTGAFAYFFNSTAMGAKWSHTRDALRSTVRFAKGSLCYRVVAVSPSGAGGAAG